MATKWLIRSVKWPLQRLLSCSVLRSSAANIAVPFVPLHCMLAERSIDARNWAKLREQTLKPFEVYGMALRIRNGTKNTELCTRLLKNASNIQMCVAIKWLPRSATLSVFTCSDIHEICHFLSLIASRLRCSRKRLAKSRAHSTKRFKENGIYQEYGTAQRIWSACQITVNA